MSWSASSTSSTACTTVDGEGKGEVGVERHARGWAALRLVAAGRRSWSRREAAVAAMAGLLGDGTTETHTESLIAEEWVNIYLLDRQEGVKCIYISDSVVETWS